MTRNGHRWHAATQVNIYVHGHAPRGTGPRAPVSTPVHALTPMHNHTYTRNAPSHARPAESLAPFGCLLQTRTETKSRTVTACSYSLGSLRKCKLA